MPTKTILITGGAGFIGSNFLRYMLPKYPEYSLINFDALTYAGNLENLTEVEKAANYRFLKADITDRTAVEKVFLDHNPDIVVHFAAESHVDRSINDSSPFVRTNVLGTQILLDVARQSWKGDSAKRFIHVSTDEVYGSLGATGYFTELTPLAPNSPYSASKTGSDLLVRAYFETYGFPGIITRCSNNYGPYQFPEKLVPLMISNAMTDKALPVYGDGLYVRDWLHVLDHCRAIDTVLHLGQPGEVYNIGGNNEWKNIDIVKLILKILNKPESLISYVKDRPGHDRRYAIDAGKIKKELGWEPKYTFEQGISETISWYQNNRAWWEKVKTGEYLEYYKQHYGH
ncbi:MAG: dTDP-glucose 4,6-dehydratase [Candidatus Margulisiibacteriota bacterium]|jgi:dTDP-glucose 4,6-dehydratase